MGASHMHPEGGVTPPRLVSIRFRAMTQTSMSGLKMELAARYGEPGYELLFLGCVDDGVKRTYTSVSVWFKEDADDEAYYDAFMPLSQEDRREIFHMLQQLGHTSRNPTIVVFPVVRAILPGLKPNLRRHLAIYVEHGVRRVMPLRADLLYAHAVMLGGDKHLIVDQAGKTLTKYALYYFEESDIVFSILHQVVMDHRNVLPGREPGSIPYGMDIAFAPDVRNSLYGVNYCRDLVAEIHRIYPNAPCPALARSHVIPRDCLTNTVTLNSLSCVEKAFDVTVSFQGRYLQLTMANVDNRVAVHRGYPPERRLISMPVHT